MDPRDIAAQGIRVANARGAGECPDPAERYTARIVLAALEAEGYSVVKLEQVGYMDPVNFAVSAFHSLIAHKPEVPVFRIVESGNGDTE